MNFFGSSFRDNVPGWRPSRLIWVNYLWAYPNNFAIERFPEECQPTEICRALARVLDEELPDAELDSLFAEVDKVVDMYSMSNDATRFCCIQVPREANTKRSVGFVFKKCGDALNVFQAASRVHGIACPLKVDLSFIRDRIEEAQVELDEARSLVSVCR